MRSHTEAMRALASVVAVSLDAARLHPHDKERQAHQAFADLMIPILKGWCTENSIELASVGVQIHGGMGFIEETGVAQYLRDSRITTIYEGTTGIQANDLIGRKLARDGGRAARAVIEQMRALDIALAQTPSLREETVMFSGAVDALERSIHYAVTYYGTDVRSVAVGAVPLLKLLGADCAAATHRAGAGLARSCVLSRQAGDGALLCGSCAGASARAGARRHSRRRGRAR
jgi:3-(methylthio)propanoyl-CoA dehydrogenase